MSPQSALRVVILLLGGFSSGCESMAEVDLVIDGVSLVDIESGTVIPNQLVQIDEGRIVDVRSSSSARRPRGAEFLDARGRYAIPGLWDMHVHALWDSTVAVDFLPKFTSAGITGIRDMGGDLRVLEQVRAAEQSARPPWPRLLAAGAILDGPEPVDPGISLAVSTPTSARQAVDLLAGREVDFVKVYTLLPRQAFLAALERAEAVGLPVVGHVPAAVSVEEAIEAGLIGIEHLRDELEPLCHAKGPADCRALLDRLRELGVHNTPTLVVLEAKGLPGYRTGDPAGDARDVPQVVERFWTGSASSQRDRPPEYFERRQALFAEESDLVGALHRAGAPILAGSDTGNPFIYPGLSLYRELELLVEAGLSPRDALHSATLGPVRFLGLADSIGALLPGFSADLVLLDDNPLEDIRNVRRVAAVVLRGRVLHPTDADRDESR